MPQLIEVWNDTVDPKHLIGGIAIGVGIAVPAFLISDHLFSSSGGDEALSHSYALLIGVIACVLLEPMGVITTSAADTRNRQEIIDEIVEEYGPLGDPRELGPKAQEEIRALGLFDALVDNHETRLREKGGHQ